MRGGGCEWVWVGVSGVGERCGRCGREVHRRALRRVELGADSLGHPHGHRRGRVWKSHPTPPPSGRAWQGGERSRGTGLWPRRAAVRGGGKGRRCGPSEAAWAAGSKAVPYEVEGDREGGAAADNQQDRLELVAGLELPGEGARVPIVGRAKDVSVASRAADDERRADTCVRWAACGCVAARGGGRQ